MEKHTTYKCPVCSEKCNEIITTYSVEESAAHICPPSRNKNRYQRLVSSLNKLWPNGNCFIYRCNNCGFGYGVPFVGGNEEYYHILHEQMGYPNWRWDYDIALDQLKQHKGGKIIDIGAGIGKFLSALGSSWEKHAMESSISTLSILKEKGIKGHQNLDNLLKNEEETFSCVTMFQVLEHISEFNEVLKASNTLLKENGTIIITVPDADAMFEQEKILQHPDMPPNHINKWSKKSLTLALMQNGFKVLSYGYEKKQFKNLRTKVHLKILTNSTKKGSLTSYIYKIQNRSIRIIFIALIAPFTFLSLIHHLNFLLKGGAFYVVAKKIK